MSPAPEMLSCSLGLSPVCRLPLSLIVPPPVTAPETVKLPEPLYEASFVTDRLAAALPDMLGMPPFSLSVQLPPMVFVTAPEAQAVPVTLVLTVVDAEFGTKKVTPLPALGSV